MSIKNTNYFECRRHIIKFNSIYIENHIIFMCSSMCGVRFPASLSYWSTVLHGTPSLGYSHHSTVRPIHAFTIESIWKTSSSSSKPNRNQNICHIRLWSSRCMDSICWTYLRYEHRRTLPFHNACRRLSSFISFSYYTKGYHDSIRAPPDQIRLPHSHPHMNMNTTT